MRSIDRNGPRRLVDVAGELDVNQRTVYWRYKSRDDQQLAVGAAAADDHLDRLAAPEDLLEPGGAAVEGIASTFERLPHEPFPVPLLGIGLSEASLKGMTPSQAMAFGRSMLAGMSVDWAAGGSDANELDGLEFELRVLQSLVLDPRPKRSRAQLCAFPQRWEAPADRATSRSA